MSIPTYNHNMNDSPDSNESSSKSPHMNASYTTQKSSTCTDELDTVTRSSDLSITFALSTNSSSENAYNRDDKTKYTNESLKRWMFNSGAYFNTAVRSERKIIHLPRTRSYIVNGDRSLWSESVDCSSNRNQLREFTNSIEDTSSETTSTETTSTETTSTETTSIENTSSESTSSENTSSENTSNENASNENASNENASKENASNENAGNENASNENAGNDVIIPDDAASSPTFRYDNSSTPSILSDSKSTMPGLMNRCRERLRNNRLTSMVSNCFKKENVTRSHRINSHIRPIFDLTSSLSVSNPLLLQFQPNETANSLTRTFLSTFKRMSCTTCKKDDSDLSVPSENLSQPPITMPNNTPVKKTSRFRNRTNSSCSSLHSFALMLCVLLVQDPTVSADNSIIDNTIRSTKQLTVNRNGESLLFVSDQEQVFHEAVEFKVSMLRHPLDLGINVLIFRFNAKSWTVCLYLQVTSTKYSRTYRVLSVYFDAPVPVNNPVISILKLALSQPGIDYETPIVEMTYGIIQQILGRDSILPPLDPNLFGLKKPYKYLSILSKINKEQSKTLRKRRNLMFINFYITEMRNSLLAFEPYEKSVLFNYEQLTQNRIINYQMNEQANDQKYANTPANVNGLNNYDISAIKTRDLTFLNEFMSTVNLPLWLTNDPIIVDVTIMSPCEENPFTILEMTRQSDKYVGNPGTKVIKPIIFHLRLLECLHNNKKKKQTEIVIVASDNAMCGLDQPPSVDTCPHLIITHAHEKDYFWTLSTFSLIVHLFTRVLEAFLAIYIVLLLLGYYYDVDVW